MQTQESSRNNMNIDEELEYFDDRAFNEQEAGEYSEYEDSMQIIG